MSVQLLERPSTVFNEHPSVGAPILITVSTGHGEVPYLPALGPLDCHASSHLYPTVYVDEKRVCQHPGKVLLTKTEKTSFQLHTVEQNSEEILQALQL